MSTTTPQVTIKQEQSKPIVFPELKRISKQQVIDYDLLSQNTYDSFYEEKKNQKIQKQTKISRHKKINKSNIKRTVEQINQFQQEEKQRYENPTQPFQYTVENQKVVVSPACKKMSENSNNKARDHFLLKSNRPSYVTLLSVVRDAACKLPNGKGTRNDICTLLKESQFVNSEIQMDKMSSVVSGALDRLHYESDPCVKFDIDKKLWFYLHREKNLEEFIKKEKNQDSKKSTESNKQYQFYILFVSKFFRQQFKMKIFYFFMTIYILLQQSQCLLGVKNLNRKSLSQQLSGGSVQDGQIIKKDTQVPLTNDEVKNQQQVGQVKGDHSSIEDIVSDQDPQDSEAERLKREQEAELKRIEELKQKQKELQEASKNSKNLQLQELQTSEKAIQEQVLNQLSINLQPDLQSANIKDINLTANKNGDQVDLQINETENNKPLPDETFQDQKYSYILSNYHWFLNHQDNKVYVALPISYSVYINQNYLQSKLIYKLGIQQNYDKDLLEQINANEEPYVNTNNLEKIQNKYCTLQQVKEYINQESDQHFLYGLVSQDSFSNNLQIGELFTQLPEDGQIYYDDSFFTNYNNLIILLLFTLKVQLGISGLDSTNVCNPNFVESIAEQIQNEFAIVRGEVEGKIEIQQKECKEADEFKENPHFTDIFDIQHLLIPIDQNSEIQTGKLILEHIKDIRFDYAIFFQNISEAPILQQLSTYDIHINYKILQMKKIFQSETVMQNLQDQIQNKNEIYQQIQDIKQQILDELNETYKDINAESPYTIDSPEVLFNLQQKLSLQQKDLLNSYNIQLQQNTNDYFKQQQELIEQNKDIIQNIQTKKIFQQKPNQKIKLIQLVQIVQNFITYAKRFLFPDIDKKKCYGLIDLKTQSIDCPEPLALCNLKFVQDLGKKNIDQQLFYDMFTFKFDHEVDLSKYFEVMHLYLLKLYQCQFMAAKEQQKNLERPLYLREQNFKNLGLRQKNYFDNVFSIDNILDIANIQYLREQKLSVDEPEKILI